MEQAPETSITPLPDQDESLPSILALGLALTSTEAEHARLEKTVAMDTTNLLVDYLEMLSLREDALRNLISTLPATTLADAAVQLEVATTFACGLKVGDLAPDRSYRTRTEVAALERLIYSALPLVADAAGLDMKRMGWQECNSIRATRFGIAE